MNRTSSILIVRKCYWKFRVFRLLTLLFADIHVYSPFVFSSGPRQQRPRSGDLDPTNVKHSAHLLARGGYVLSIYICAFTFFHPSKIFVLKNMTRLRLRKRSVVVTRPVIEFLLDQYQGNPNYSLRKRWRHKMAVCDHFTIRTNAKSSSLRQSRPFHKYTCRERLRLSR